MRIAILGLFIAVTASGQCSALSCAPDSRSPEQIVSDNYNAASLVAVVEVIAIERKVAAFSWGKERGVWAKLLPKYVFKGAAAPEWTFYAAAPDHSSRNPDLTKGQLLLIYARETEPFRWPGQCSSSSGGDLISRFNELPILFRLSGRSGGS